MSMSDPLADMCTRIRNAVSARHETVRVPASNVKQAVADVLATEGTAGLRRIQLQPLVAVRPSLAGGVQTRSTEVLS